jgi:hypothetical protein
VSFADAFISEIDDELNGNVVVGFVKFATTAVTVLGLSTPATAITTINTTAYSGGFTNTADAINKCRLVLTAGNNTKKILVLLTDGNPTACLNLVGCPGSCPSTGNTCTNGATTIANAQATLAKNSSPNITLIPVGVGSNATISTTNLANWGTGGNYLTVADFDDLPSIIANLTDAVLCPST